MKPAPSPICFSQNLMLLSYYFTAIHPLSGHILSPLHPLRAIPSPRYISTSLHHLAPTITHHLANPPHLAIVPSATTPYTS